MRVYTGVGKILPKVERKPALNSPEILQGPALPLIPVIEWCSWHDKKEPIPKSGEIVVSIVCGDCLKGISERHRDLKEFRASK